MKILLINIFSLTTLLCAVSKPVKNTTDVYDLVYKEINSTCPEIYSNPIVNKNSEYLKNCATPEGDIKDINKNNYLCIGVLNADLKLCKSLPKKENTLPKNFNELSVEINKTIIQPPDLVCKEFLKYNRTDEKITNSYMVELDKILRNENLCKKLCTGFIANTNELCALMYFTYTKISDIKVDNLSVTPVQNKGETQTNVGNSTLPISSSAKSEVNKIQVVKSVIKTAQLNGESVKEKIKLTDNVSNNKSSQIITTPQSSKIHALKEGISDSVATNTSPNIVQTIQTQPLQSKDPIPVPKETQNIKQPSNTQPQNTEPKQLQNNEPREMVEESPLGQISQTNQKVNDAKDTDIQLGDDDMNEDTTNSEDYAGANYINDLESKKSDPLVSKQKDDISRDPVKHNIDYDEDIEDSNFFTYFMFISILFICGYIAYHNKQKILALVLEGRRERGSRRRPNTASYRKLNSNLEEAVTSKTGGSAAHVIY